MKTLIFDVDAEGRLTLDPSDGGFAHAPLSRKDSLQLAARILRAQGIRTLVVDDVSAVAYVIDEQPVPGGEG